MSTLTKLELIPILKTALTYKDLENLSVEIVGNTDQGDGYAGDIIFASIGGTIKGVTQQFDVVLKCGKKSKAIRESTPAFRESFQNEIYVYSKIVPTFEEFALQKSPDLVFDCIPRCMGTYLDENMEVIVLENLRKSGYSLWDRKKPATLEHLKIVLHQYGKWHALSAALRDQQPQKYKELANGFITIWPKFKEQMGMPELFGKTVKEGYDLLKDELEEDSRQTWLNLKDQTDDIFVTQTTRKDCFTVLTHGDCWINNFMFKCENSDPLKPLKSMLLDWQLASDCTPICDLSLFLYSSISPKDLEDNFDSLLKLYHDSFSSYVYKLGSDPQKVYSYEEFLRDWKRFARFGIVMSPLVYKVTQVDKEDAPDIAQSLEAGKDFGQVFDVEIKDTTLQKWRLRSLVQHAVQREFI